MEEEPREGLREEVRALRRHALASSSGGEDVFDSGRAKEQRKVGVAAIDTRGRLLHARRVVEPVEPVPVGELDVELAFLSPQKLDLPRPIPDCCRSPKRLAGEERECLAEVGARLSVPHFPKIRAMREDSMRRKDL